MGSGIPGLVLVESAVSGAALKVQSNLLPR